MMTRPSAAGESPAAPREAERLAAERGRTLITLDTASEEGGRVLREARIYAGEIPDYALKPNGGLTATRLYWKRLSAPACQ